MRLTINSVGLGDFGSFRCVSKNSLGDTDGAIKLYREYISFSCVFMFSCWRIAKNYKRGNLWYLFYYHNIIWSLSVILEHIILFYAVCEMCVMMLNNEFCLLKKISRLMIWDNEVKFLVWLGWNIFGIWSHFLSSFPWIIFYFSSKLSNNSKYLLLWKSLTWIKIMKSFSQVRSKFPRKGRRLRM